MKMYNKRVFWGFCTVVLMAMNVALSCIQSHQNRMEFNNLTSLVFLPVL